MAHLRVVRLGVGRIEGLDDLGGLEHLEICIHIRMGKALSIWRWHEMEMAGDGGLGHLYYGALYYVYV